MVAADVAGPRSGAGHVHGWFARVVSLAGSSRYKAYISIDRRHGVIRRGKTTDAAAHDGARLREGLIDPNNTASDVWADTAYRSAENERYLDSIGRVSRIHRRKPRGRSMARHHARANAAKSAGRAHVEHPFAHQKGMMGLVVDKRRTGTPSEYALPM